MTGGSHGEKIMYAMGAEFVEVRVHSLTREIRVPRIVGAFAAARLINTRTAHSQLMGGMIWGVSSALHESTEIDARYARYVNDNLADYLVPVNADILIKSKSFWSLRSIMTSIRRGSKASANSPMSAPRRPWPTQFITPPARAFANYRYGSRSCS